MSEIKLFELKCRRCGGQLENAGASLYKCASCGRTYEKQIVTDVADTLREVLNEQKQEAVANLRRQLWAEMHEQYINSAKIVDLARNIKKYLPEDYFANFCEVANSGNDKQVSSFLKRTSRADMADYADVVLDFMLKSVTAANLNAISLFIDRAFKDDTVNFDRYITAYEREAQKVNSGIYELNISRDVFLAYSSKDIERVIDLCDYLEDNDISCFLAQRNLRHGRGAVDNYEQALKTAIDNCNTVVFVSSKQSRNMSCDAFTKELSYIRQKDINGAPPQFRYAYDKLPLEFMMPRVEYLIEDYYGNIAERTVKEFFHGLEWCKNKEDVADRIVKYRFIGDSYYTSSASTASAISTPAEPVVKADKNVKYCKSCGTQNRLAARFCSKCKGTEFAESYDDYLASKVKYCANCGNQCDLDANACDLCGAEMFVNTKKEYEDLQAQDAEDKRLQRVREENERRRKAEEERKRIEQERKRAEEENRLRKLREEQERLKKAEEERKRKQRAEEERKRLEEEDRLRRLREEQERLKKAEEERKRKEAEERKRLEEEKPLRKLCEENERIRKEEEEQLRKLCEENERKRKEEEEQLRKLCEENERKYEEEHKHRDEERKRNKDELFTSGDYRNIGDGYVTFGTYPQSLKAANVDIWELFDKERNYYLGSDYCFYSLYKGKYYKVEPIKWKVLQSGSELIVVADDILDAHRFAEKKNIYEKSEIRQFLNDAFFNRAFNSYQKDKILTTTVDNGLLSTLDKKNKYVCKDTTDRVYLLSKKEATHYLTDSESRKRVPTGYAVAKGAYKSTSSKRNGKGCGTWWLRSPNSDSGNNTQNITGIGGFDCNIVDNLSYGVVPAIKITPKDDRENEAKYREKTELLRKVSAIEKTKLFEEKCKYLEEKNKREKEWRKRLEEENRKRLEEEERLRKIHEEKERKRKHCEKEERKLYKVKVYLKIGDYKKIDDDYITFGSYPQSKKLPDVKIGELADKDRGYYLGSDDNLYAECKGIYYKVEPIKWKVLQNNDSLFIVADDVLDAHRFAENSNNYADSEVRQFLNNEFFNRAFNNNQKDRILTTVVDNSLSSAGDDKNTYICENTDDKVFLLSVKEASDYLISQESRKRVPTEYAVARGVLQHKDKLWFMRDGKGCACWWLRSPNKFLSSSARYVDFLLKFETASAKSEYEGVVPALYLKIAKDKLPQ